MSAHKIAISISYGDMENLKYTRSVHMLSFDDCELTADEAKLFQESIVSILAGIKHKRTDKEILGVYKVEHPATDTMQ